MDIVTDINEAKLAATEVTLAKNIAAVLERHYPGYLWAVNVRGDQGIVTVHNLMLSGRWGFILKIKDLDTNLNAVMRAGGEILERYRLSRSRANFDAILHVPRDFAGNPVAEQG